MKKISGLFVFLAATLFLCTSAYAYTLSVSVYNSNDKKLIKGQDVLLNITGPSSFQTTTTTGTYSNKSLPNGKYTISAIWKGALAGKQINSSKAATSDVINVDLYIKEPKPPAKDITAKFKDPAFLAAVRYSLGLGQNDPIMDDKAKQPIYLFASDKGIKSIEGIEWLVKLTGASLNGNQISDLTPIQYLKKLNSLDLADNMIVDISPICALTSLKQILSLDNNQISDISCFASLTQLKNLIIADNQIEDISALSKLYNLEMIDAGSNQISNISPLAKLFKLHSLILENNQISDLSPLDGLENLNMLKVGHNQISDISAMPNFSLNDNGTQKIEFDLSGNKDLENIIPLIEVPGVGVGYIFKLIGDDKIPGEDIEKLKSTGAEVVTEE